MMAAARPPLISHHIISSDPAEGARRRKYPVVRIKAFRANGENGGLRQGPGRHSAFPNKDLDDFIILRYRWRADLHACPWSSTITTWASSASSAATGSPHQMPPRSGAIIYKAIGAGTCRSMAHIPRSIPRPGRRKSSRSAHGRAGRRGLSRDGLPAPGAGAHYLVRLGWSHGDDEVISLAR